MGILKRLFPWYHWDDRWAHHVFSLPNPGAGEAQIWTAEPGFRYQLLTILWTHNTQATGGKRFPDITVFRGNLRYFHSTTVGSVSSNQSVELAFISNMARSAPGGAAFHTFANLSDSIYMLPGDVLHIAVEAIEPFDRIEDIVISAKRWID